jgi:hypothetical protein
MARDISCPNWNQDRRITANEYKLNFKSSERDEFSQIK